MKFGIYSLPVGLAITFTKMSTATKTLFVASLLFAAIGGLSAKPDPIPGPYQVSFGIKSNFFFVVVQAHAIPTRTIKNSVHIRAQGRTHDD